MKVAVFHNYLDNIGGAEIVTLTLARELQADVYTTNIDHEKISQMGFADVAERIFSIGTVPNRAPFKQQLSLWYFRTLRLKDYDQYIISGDWAMSAAVNHHPNIWYVHSPLNEIWAFKTYVRTTLVPFMLRPLFELWAQFNRFLSRRYARHVDIWLCNSATTQARIQRYYRQPATVVHPPVQTARYRNEPAGDYWLSVNRFVRHKRIEVQMAAFAAMPDKKLILVASYEPGVPHFEEYRQQIEQICSPNVSIMNWVDEATLIDLYAGCRGFIATAQHEDFGLTVVEALAAGKPVVAANAGGYRETVTPECGVLLDEVSPSALAAAVTDIDDQLESDEQQYASVCRQAAAKYDIANFVAQIRQSLSA